MVRGHERLRSWIRAVQFIRLVVLSRVERLPKEVPGPVPFALPLKGQGMKPQGLLQGIPDSQGLKTLSSGLPALSR